MSKRSVEVLEWDTLNEQMRILRKKFKKFKKASEEKGRQPATLVVGEQTTSEDKENGKLVSIAAVGLHEGEDIPLKHRRRAFTRGRTGRAEKLRRWALTRGGTYRANLIVMGLHAGEDRSHELS